MRSLILSSFLCVTSAAFAAESTPPADAGVSQASRCEHGVKKALCTRCNPKLAPVFKAKGDWCGEHGVPESQCARCNPELAKKGVK